MRYQQVVVTFAVELDNFGDGRPQLISDVWEAIGFIAEGTVVREVALEPLSEGMLRLLVDKHDGDTDAVEDASKES